MNRPPWSVYFVGNLPTTCALVLLGAVLIGRWWTGQADPGAAIVGGVLLATAARARTRLTSYRRWKQAWDRMGGEAPKPPSKFLPRVAGVALIAIVAAYLFEHRDAPENRWALIWLAVGLAVAAIYGLTKARNQRPAKHNQKDVPVTVCVTRPLIEAPPLQIAYQRLPEHCQRLLASNGKRC